jgi:hypothetical protein
MSEAKFHRPGSWKLSAIWPLLSLFRRRIDSIVGQGMFRDSVHFLVAALSLAVVMGWLSFVTIAAQTYGTLGDARERARLYAPD